ERAPPKVGAGRVSATDEEGTQQKRVHSRRGCAAERAGFEPADEFPHRTLSKRVPSATRPPLPIGCQPKRHRRSGPEHSHEPGPSATPHLEDRRYCVEGAGAGTTEGGAPGAGGPGGTAWPGGGTAWPGGGGTSSSGGASGPVGGP